VPAISPLYLCLLFRCVDTFFSFLQRLGRDREGYIPSSALPFAALAILVVPYHAKGIFLDLCGSSVMFLLQYVIILNFSYFMASVPGCSGCSWLFDNCL
jgi:hypothetical protein